MTTRLPRALLVVAAAALTPLPASAQGTLGTQGLGFPTGQLSVPSRLLGGATAEADALTPINPAALSMLSTAIVTMQVEPEYRRTEVGGASDASSVSRFPLFSGALPLGSRWTVGAAASTLLDRTWSTTSRDTQVVGSDTLGATMRRRSEGAISDVRLAAAYNMLPWLRLGVSGHVYTGRAILQSIRAFDDADFTADTVQGTTGFHGFGLTLGAQAFWPRVAAIGVAYRRGGALRAYDGDVIIDRGTAPGHLGVSVVYLGIRGTQLAARVAMDDWSAMRGLGDSLRIHEGLDMGFGADVRGPAFGGSAIALRAGFRWRTLPFSATSEPVRERSVSFGFGFPMAAGRVELNVGGILSSRSMEASGIDASERAWTLSSGFIVRP